MPAVFQLDEASALLRRTPATLASLLRDLDSAWVTVNEGGDTWSCHDVVAHLADLEDTDWPLRLEVALDGDGNGTFAPVDRIRFRTSLANKNLSELLDLFGERRMRNLADLDARRIATHDLSRRAMHPALGSVTLGELLATWVVHDLTHISQIVRVMAHRYTAAVGPWHKYLSVLSDRGPERQQR